LPEGVLRLSPLEPNVLNPEGLQECIRGLITSSKTAGTRNYKLLSGVPRAVTLILPDLAVRLAVLHLQELPVRYEEREALIRWRLGQEQLLSLAGAKVCFQVLPGIERVTGSANTVLAVVVQEAVLDQYESVCDAVGLLPQQVEVSSLSLFNLWVRSLGGPARLTADFLWVNVSDGGFTALVFHKGHLVFLRTKLQGVGGSHLNGGDAGAKWGDKVIEECAVSMYACQQHHPALAVANIVLVGDDGTHHGLSEKLAKELGVTVKHLGWDDLCRGRTQPDALRSLTGLQAMAGLL
jgi:Tfp pilus assembly PilM family ATPase